MSYTDMAATAKPDKDTIKQTVPITFVLHHLAGSVFEQEAGEWVCASPLRPDNNPSFRVWGDNLTRWIDFATGDQGDVFDIVSRLEGLTSFDAQTDRVWQLYTEHYDKWTGPKTGAPKATFDVEAAAVYLDQLEGDAAEALGRLFEQRSDSLQDVNTEWLAAEFEISTDDGESIIVPYLSRERSLVAVKTRTPGTPMRAAPGTSFASGVLYGEWRDTDKRNVIVLCEGETDVWAAAWQLRDHAVSVLGLPTGAGSAPRGADRLRNRKVVLAFDADDAGRRATLSWIRALHQSHADVYLMPIPDGRDLATAFDIPQRLEKALETMVLTDPGTVLELRSTYCRNNQAQTSISNFVLDIRTALVTPEGGVFYEVVYRGSSRSTILGPSDLSSPREFQKWARRHGLTWDGNERDTSGLAGYLHFLAYGAPRREAVHVAGLYDGHFVWPGGSLGPRDVEYVPPPTGAVGVVDIRLNRDESAIVPHILRHLIELAPRSTTTPILAWLAMAPLRTLLEQFPILNVTGGSGTGKTTLLTRMLTLFSGSNMMSTLTGTTRFALLAQLQSTNGFPVWFDEYRPGARSTTLQELNQLLRDAYTSQVSLKGGASDKWNEVSTFQTHAPIIVSGEDSFHEKSHLDRMVVVNLTSKGKNPRALAALPDVKESAVAPHYLGWLLGLLDDGWLPSPVAVGPEHWNDRQRWNLGVLQLGWDLLSEWCAGWGFDIGDADWTSLIAEAETASTTDPVLDALEWALDEPMMMSHVWREEDTICVRVEGFVREVNRMTSITLPGGSSAIGRLLVNEYGGESARRSLGNTRARVCAIPIPDQLK